MCFSRGRIVVAALVFSALGMASVRAQDVAEAARQARERKAQQQNSGHHVYTDDDLKKARILTPEDAARAAANRTNPDAPARPAEQAQDAKQQTPSLGEVARAYRREKVERQAAQAAREAEAGQSRYRLELPKSSLAAPKPSVAPNASSLRGDELRPVRPGFPGPAEHKSLRVSPFLPRRAIRPTQPVAPLPLATFLGSLRREEVRPGDTWWKLARRSIGSGAQWEELLRVNPGVSRDPKKLLAGISVFVPESPPARASPAQSSIVVQKGDTLWSLAREHLGCSHAWPALAAANPGLKSANQLQIGMRLQIPAAESAGCSGRGRTASRK